ncbi:MAG: MarR family transcriptional regulator [Oscillospiraceae bacterium]
MLTASQVYTYTRRILDAYAAVMQPLSAELDMAQNAVDILLFLANNPGLDTARDICTYRKLKPGIVSFHVDNLVREGYLLRTRDPSDRAPLPARVHGQGGADRRARSGAAGAVRRADVRGPRARRARNVPALSDSVRAES